MNTFLTPVRAKVSCALEHFMGEETRIELLLLGFSFNLQPALADCSVGGGGM